MRRWACVLGCAFTLTSLPGCASGVFHPGRSRERLDAATRVSGDQLQTIELSKAAQSAIDRQAYDEARVDLEQLLAKTPRSAELNCRLGKVLQLQGWPDAASAGTH